MVRLIVGRLLYTGAVLLGVATVVFVLVHMAGDPLAGLVPPGSSAEQTASIRRHYGLDRPLPEQYATFLAHAVRGDFGRSWRQDQPALGAVLDRLPATLALSGAALALAIGIGVPLGLVAAMRPLPGVGPLTTLLTVSGQALPGFWLGTLLILVFAVRLSWLPPSGADGPRALVLPAITLAAFPAATIARLLRASVGETLRRDFVRTARGKGLAPRAVAWRHALPNGLLPLLAYFGVQAGYLVGGAVIVEAVFAYPGVGRLALGAVTDRDLPLLQAFVIVVAALIVGINLIVDLLGRWLDPRLRTVARSRLGEGTA